MSIKKNKFFVTTAVLVFLIIPFFTFAADSTYFPICACCNSSEPCHFSDVFVVVDKLIDAALYLSFFLAVIMIIKGGVTIILGADKPAEVTKGRETITWAVYGMIVAFGSWLIIDTILKVFTGGGVATYLTF